MNTATFLDGFFRAGRMLSGSKQGPAGHTCVWNANICTKAAGKIWFGDLDLDADDDVEKLKALARVLGTEIFILRERDARFTNEASPLFENAVAVVAPSGVVHRAA